MRLLALAPTPIFALLASVSASQETSLQSLICSAGHSSPLTGMVSMYVLMSVFHAAPWVELLRKNVPRGCRAPRSSASWTHEISISGADFDPRHGECNNGRGPG